MKLKLKETLAKILRHRIIVNVPYSDFTWDSTQKLFNRTNISNLIPSGYEYIGCIVEMTNGAAIGCAYYNTSVDVLRVMGWIPSNSASIGNSYVFKCKMILQLVGGVLRNPVISRLTAIFTSFLFGGDVDEAEHKEAVGEDTEPNPAYRGNIFSRLDSNKLKCKWAKGDRHNHSTRWYLHLLCKDSSMQSEHAGFLRTAFGLRCWRLVWVWASSSDIYMDIDADHDLLCRHINVSPNKLHLHRSRLFESSSHSITISERRWAA